MVGPTRPNPRRDPIYRVAQQSPIGWSDLILDQVSLGVPLRLSIKTALPPRPPQAYNSRPKILGQLDGWTNSAHSTWVHHRWGLPSVPLLISGSDQPSSGPCGSHDRVSQTACNLENLVCSLLFHLQQGFLVWEAFLTIQPWWIT